MNGARTERRDASRWPGVAGAALAAVCLASAVAAQGDPAAERRALLHAFLVAPQRPETPALLEQLHGGFTDVVQVEAAVAGLVAPAPLGAGFHALTAPCLDPPLSLAAIVPRSVRPERGWPLAIVPAPAPYQAPDEMILRARYGCLLDLGWTVLSVFQEGGRYVPGRDPWSDGPDLVPALAGDLALRLPLDRDRVILFSRTLETNPTSTEKVAFHAGDPTALAGLVYVLPGTHGPDAPPDPGPWRGRLIAVYASRTTGDAERLFTMRLGALGHEHGFEVWSHRDQALDWKPRWALRAEPLADLCGRVRRGPGPARFEARLGGKLPSRCEWIEVHDLAAPLHIVAERDGDSIRIATPDEPGRAVLAADIYVKDASPSIAVSLNGHPLHGGAVPHGVREALLVARQRCLTGRACERVLRLRP